MKKNLLTFILSFSFFIANAQKVHTLVSGPSDFNDGLVQDSLGNIYASYYYGSVVTKITPSGQTSVHVSGLTDPNGLTFNPEGLLLIPEATANRITLIDSAGNKSLFATLTNPSGLLYLPSGDLLVAQYNQDKISIIDTAGNISDYWTGAQLSGGPVGMVYNASEKTTYVGGFDDGRILKRDSTGAVTQLADLPGWCGFICEAGNYIYATAFSVHKIYRIAKDGSGSMEIAGTGAIGQVDGSLSQARFNNPNGIISSKNGDTLYISDYGTRSLRVISGVDSIVPVTGVENEIEDYEISIWPNPAKNFLNVFIDSNENPEFEILTNTGRKLIHSGLNIMRKNESTFDIILPSDMSSGKYHLKITGKTKNEVLPFFKR